MRKLKILVLSQTGSLPPEELSREEQARVPAQEREIWKTSFDVIQTLENMGHLVTTLGVTDEIAPIRRAIREGEPHVVFNLVEAFKDLAIFDQHVVSLLELMRVPYTGCNPRGLILARDKALSKKILTYHRIRVPDFAVFPKGRKVRRPKRLDFPLFVKSLSEDASFGISQASLIHNDEKLVERVEFIHSSVDTDAIVEEYIEGRELYVPILGNSRLQVLPVWELGMESLDEGSRLIATEKAKFDVKYQERHGVYHGPAEGLSEALQRKIERVSKRIYRALGLSGYARIDFRLDPNEELYFLEANPNPDIAAMEEVASSAELSGYDYSRLLQRILNLGLSYRPA